MSAIDTSPRAQASAVSAAAGDELAQANEMLNSVMRVHGPVHPELRALVPALASLREAVGRRFDAASEAKQAGIGESVAELRDLTGGYDVNRAVCRTHRRLLETLAALERDLLEPWR